MSRWSPRTRQGAWPSCSRRTAAAAGRSTPARSGRGPQPRPGTRPLSRPRATSSPSWRTLRKNHRSQSVRLACAGVIRTPTCRWRRRPCLPRVRGGAPNTMVYWWNTALSAPHARRCSRPAAGHPGRYLVCSARAGVIPPCGPCPTSSRCPPRMRGGAPQIDPLLLEYRRLASHARRCPVLLFTVATFQVVRSAHVEVYRRAAW